MELMVTAHKLARNKKLGWGTVPIYFTEHSMTLLSNLDK